MQIIVVGGGKVGYYLTKTLMEHGHKAYLIEQDRAVCARVANDLDITVICGDGSTIDILEAADAAQADALIAVTGRDQDNLVACQLAKRVFHVGRTVARINNPKNAALIKQLGVDIPVSSTDNIARLLEREVDAAAFRQLMPLNRGEASLSEFQLPEDYPMSGVKLSELRLPEESVVVSISRDGHLIIPRGNAQLFAGDKVLVVCTDASIHELSRKIGIATKKP